MKGVGWGWGGWLKLIPPEKTTIKKPSFIRVKVNFLLYWDIIVTSSLSYDILQVTGRKFDIWFNFLLKVNKSVHSLIGTVA